MKRLKCKKCNRTLLLIEYGKLEIKCPRCGYIMEYESNEVMSRKGAEEQPDQPADEII